MEQVVKVRAGYTENTVTICGEMILAAAADEEPIPPMLSAVLSVVEQHLEDLRLKYEALEARFRELEVRSNA